MKKNVIFGRMCLIILFFCSCSKMVDGFENSTGDVWKERAEQITKGCRTDYEKAEAIFEWECANIAYDVSYSIYTAEECWQQRKGVCQAYSALFVKLATACDLEAKIISGDCRTLNYPDGDGRHAWIKANTELGWILLDPTWGAGYVNGNVFTSYQDDTWFDAAPELMIFTHFPDNASNQMLAREITKSQFRELPLIEPKVSVAGWEGYDVLNYFLNHLGEPAPLLYQGFTENAGKFILVDMPYCGNMKIGRSYTLEILSLDENLSVSSSPNPGWKKEAVEDGVLYRCVFKPESEGGFNVYFNNNGIMKYETVR